MNEEIVRQLFDAWNGRDLEGVLRYFDPEVEFHPGLVPPGEDPEYRGREGVRKWMLTVDELWVAVTVEREERIEVASDRVLAIDRLPILPRLSKP